MHTRYTHTIKKKWHFSVHFLFIVNISLRTFRYLKVSTVSFPEKRKKVLKNKQLEGANKTIELGSKKIGKNNKNISVDIDIQWMKRLKLTYGRVLTKQATSEAIFTTENCKG